MISLLISQTGIVVQRQVLCAFKCIVKDKIYGLFLEYGVLNAYSDLEH